MSKIKVFLDSSALISGVISSTGAARVLFVMSESGQIEAFISEHVITESERSLARKVPHALPEFRQTIRDAQPRIIHNPTQQVSDHLYLINDPADVPILLSAMKAKVNYLATHNRRHFLDDPTVAEKSGLRIGTPGDVLAWLRENL
jgi:predicted nucleic acid-binding protein